MIPAIPCVVLGDLHVSRSAPAMTACVQMDIARRLLSDLLNVWMWMNVPVLIPAPQWLPVLTLWEVSSAPVTLDMWEMASIATTLMSACEALRLATCMLPVLILRAALSALVYLVSLEMGLHLIQDVLMWMSVPWGVVMSMPYVRTQWAVSNASAMKVSLEMESFALMVPTLAPPCHVTAGHTVSMTHALVTAVCVGVVWSGVVEVARQL